MVSSDEDCVDWDSWLRPGSLEGPGDSYLPPTIDLFTLGGSYLPPPLRSFINYILAVTKKQAAPYTIKYYSEIALVLRESLLLFNSALKF